MNREDVYEVIDSERDYQDGKWNCQTTTSCGKHSLEEWFMYIEDYLNEAKHTLSRLASPEAEKIAIHNVRKIAAMCVHAMEQHGCPSRVTSGHTMSYTDYNGKTVVVDRFGNIVAKQG
jgi:hypothetical protein